MARKSERIEIKTTNAHFRTLQRAAALAEKRVDEFLLDAGLAAASESLAGRLVFRLSSARWRRFVKELHRPVRAKPRLARLLSEPSVLE